MRLKSFLFALISALLILGILELISGFYIFEIKVSEHLTLASRSAAFFITLVLGCFYYDYIEKNESLDNWETYRVLLTNKYLLFLISLSSGISFIYRVLPEAISKEGFPVTLHLYWVSGLLVLVSYFLFLCLSPKIFSYKNYVDFYNKDRTNLSIWNDIETSKEIINKKIRLDSENKSKYLKSWRILTKAEQYNACPNVFFITKNGCSLNLITDS
ncbi:hypothetical protein [Endozoicomonas sp.]|uniref:hypothetical protein n=1 Tax=Endozoicomonas sp. TaxID=1892382 RepID=UPI003AF8D9D4